MADAAAARVPYAGAIEPGMVFDFEPGKKHKYERLVVTRRHGARIWATGRSAETFHNEPEFRASVVFVADRLPKKPRPEPLRLEGRYHGPIEVGMVFDFEPGKRHQYERITITDLKGPHIWARGRCGQTYYEEQGFREHVVAVPAERR
jgi:Xaa-Pro aminopeptidase